MLKTRKDLSKYNPFEMPNANHSREYDYLSNSEFPFILRLAFSRDVCVKFSEDIRHEANLKRYRETHWEVIGKFDFLRVESLSRLTDVASNQFAPPNMDAGGITIGAHSGLVLVPFDDFFDAIKDDSFRVSYTDFVDRVLMGHQGSDDGAIEFRKNHPLLMVARIYLSAAAYELETPYTGVLKSLDAARDLLSQLIDSFRNQGGILPPNSNIRFFRTLGSPDIVMLAMPQTPEELVGTYHFLSEARKTELREVLGLLRKSRNDSADGDAIRKDSWDNDSAHLNCPGHAFAAIDETLSFRCHDRGDFEFEYAGPKSQDEYRQDELRLQFNLEFEMRLDSGHEQHFLQKFSQDPYQAQEAIEEAKKGRRAAGLYTVRGRYKHLSDFVRSWNKLWFDHRFRAANIMDSASTPTFAPPFQYKRTSESNATAANQNPQQLAWKLLPSLERELERIEVTVQKWANLFLSPEQRQELLNVVRTFRSCFFHLELVSSPRDLLPFMRQLAFCCSLTEYWSEFRRSLKGNIEIFTAQVVQLLSHLHRAVRNRLEHRSQHADPTIPHTLEHGASKLITAYTTVYWLCSELFSRGDQFPDHRYCVANRLAVCVAAGNEGRVSFNEVFSDFRKFVETHEFEDLAGTRRLIRRKKKTLISDLRLGAELFSDCWSGELDQDLHHSGWTSRLLLLDISGYPLFQPEQVLIHSLHETAQFSDWYESDQLGWLRAHINFWAYQESVSSMRICAAISLVRSRLPNSSYSDTEIGHAIERIGDPAFVKEVEEIIKGNVHRRNQLDSFLRHFARMAISGDFTDSYRNVFSSFLANCDPRGVAREIYQRLEANGQEMANWEKCFNIMAKAQTQSPHRYSQIPLAARHAIAGLRQIVFYDKSVALDALATEISADIGHLAAFEHIMRSFGSLALTERCANVHLMYLGIAMTHLHRCGTAVSVGDEWNLILTRWLFAVSMVCHESPEESIIDWVSVAVREMDTTDIGSEGGEKFARAWNENQSEQFLRTVSPTMKYLLEAAAEHVDGPQLDTNSRKKSPGSLRVRIAPALDQPGVRFGLPSLREEAQQSSWAERDLLAAFAETWKRRRENSCEVRLLRQRLDLIMRLWSKATRLRHERIFETAWLPNDEAGEPTTADLN